MFSVTMCESYDDAFKKVKQENKLKYNIDICKNKPGGRQPNNEVMCKNCLHTFANCTCNLIINKKNKFIKN
jgi:hypothetical protein